MAKAKNTPALALRPKITPADIDTLVVTLCRLKAVRTHAFRFPMAEYFTPDEFAVGVLVEVIANLHGEYLADVIPYLDLKTAVNERFEALGDAVTNEQWNEVLASPSKKGDRGKVGLLYHAYRGVKDGDYSAAGALKLLRRFLEERGVDAPIKRALLASGNSVINYKPLLDKASRVSEQVEGIGADTGATLASTAAKKQEVFDVVETKLPYLSSFLNGGFMSPAIYGITAGTGYGKSTMVHQIAVSVAQAFLVRAEKKCEAPREAMVFSFEDDERRMFVRSMAHTALISKDFMMHVVDPETQLRRYPSEYDHILAKEKGKSPEEFPCEYDRYRAVIETLINYSYYDMTQPGCGDGGVDEICGKIAQFVELTGRRPGLVVVDSIDLLTENWLRSQHGAVDVKQLVPSEIPAVVHRLRKQIGVAYGCTVLVTNQLAGADLKKSSGARLDHSNAGNSKSWGKGLDGHWVLGKPTLDDFVSMFLCTKDRHGGNVGKYAMIRLDGLFGRWLDASDDFILHNGEITRKSIIDAVHAGAIASKPKKMPHTSAGTLDDDDVIMGGM